MKSEMNFYVYQTKYGLLVEAPKDVKPIECKWIYKRKIGADGPGGGPISPGSWQKGFRQRQGIDFDETFFTYSPV